MKLQHSGQLRVCVVAESASFKFGGEASLPLHYFSRLRARGIEAWLIVHERTREELEALLPDEKERIHFIRDEWFHKLVWRVSGLLPRRIAEAALWAPVMVINQRMQRAIARELIATHQVNLIHQPVPVSPRAPSSIGKVGVPVVIGPMNGGMEYPSAFRSAESWFTRASVHLARKATDLVNSVISGKKFADVLLVANQRTRSALPRCVRGRVEEVTENGVDLGLWSRSPQRPPAERDPRFVFIGRLVDWKRLDLAIRALAEVPGARLEVIGEGPMRERWTSLAASLGLAERTSFLGWLSQKECAARLHSATSLLLPSIYECGGAVVLEAMAAGTPVIAVDWGGPADYLDETCGILISPKGAEEVVRGFSMAMTRLIQDPEICHQLGRCGRNKIERLFDWEKKLDQVIQIYEHALAHSAIESFAASTKQGVAIGERLGN